MGMAWQVYLQAIAVRGGADAVLHANSLGIFGGDHADEYQTDEVKAAYYCGRLGGDGFAMGQSATEINAGIGGGAGLALVTGGTSLVGGALVAAHGAVGGWVASADMGATLKKLYHLSNAANGASDGNNSNNSKKETSENTTEYHEDYQTKNTKQSSAYFKSERQARNLARQKIGKDPVQVEKYKWRSRDGKWQYRAKPGDVADKHIHLEELNPKTGEVLQNIHLRW